MNVRKQQLSDSALRAEEAQRRVRLLSIVFSESPHSDRNIAAVTDRQVTTSSVEGLRRTDLRRYPLMS